MRRVYRTIVSASGGGPQLGFGALEARLDRLVVSFRRFPKRDRSSPPARWRPARVTRRPLGDTRAATPLCFAPMPHRKGHAAVALWPARGSAANGITEVLSSSYPSSLPDSSFGFDEPGRRNHCRHQESSILPITILFVGLWGMPYSPSAAASGTVRFRPPSSSNPAA